MKDSCREKSSLNKQQRKILFQTGEEKEGKSPQTWITKDHSIGHMGGGEGRPPHSSKGKKGKGGEGGAYCREGRSKRLGGEKKIIERKRERGGNMHGFLPGGKRGFPGGQKKGEGGPSSIFPKKGGGGGGKKK